MKKSLIALAALATVGAAQAQSSVTLYGALDAGYSDMEKTFNTTVQSQKAFSFSNYTTSRWGIRGTEDLGGGLTAAFVVESGISSDVMAGYYQTGTSAATIANANGTVPQATTLGDRALFATISNKTGTTVGLGFASTAVRDISLKYDAAGGSRLVGNLVTMDASLSSNRATGVAIAQRLGAVTVRAGLSQNNTQASQADAENKNRSGYLVGADYSAGAFEAGYARQQIKSTTSTANTTTFTSNAEQTIDMLGASYDLKTFKLFASYANIKVEDSVGATPAVTTPMSSVALFSGEGKRNMFAVGASVPMGKTTLFATVSEGKIDQALTGVTGNVKRDMSGYTVGARYAFSKRTTAYGAIGQAKIDGTSGATNQLKVEQTTVGLMHSF